MTVSEPRFSPGDVEALLASRRAERAPRGPHGHLLSDTTDPELASRWVVPKPSRDYLAQKLHAAQEQYRKQYPTSDQSSLLWSGRLQEE